MSIPEPVARAAELMSTFPGPWYLCGGWAVDAWLGRQSRDHGDMDFAVFHDDQAALFEHLAGWRLVGHDNTVDDDSKVQWYGRRLDIPAHIHATDGFELDIQINEQAEGEWVLNREPRVAMPLDRCAGQSPWGVPTVDPGLILFYKAHAPV